jgi:hypothetical protein
MHKLEFPTMKWEQLKSIRINELDSIIPHETLFKLNGMGFSIDFDKMLIDDDTHITYSFELSNGIFTEKLKHFNDHCFILSSYVTDAKENLIVSKLLPGLGVVEHGFYTDRSNKEKSLLTLLQEFIYDDTKCRLSHRIGSFGRILSVKEGEHSPELNIYVLDNDYLYFQSNDYLINSLKIKQDIHHMIDVVKDIIQENRLQLLF